MGKVSPLRRRMSSEADAIVQIPAATIVTSKLEPPGIRSGLVRRAALEGRLVGTADVAVRYHQLFAEMLQAELGRREPDAVAELHRRTGLWFAEHDLPEEGIRHFLAAGDVRAADDLVALVYNQYASIRRLQTVLRWLGMFSDEQVRSSAALAVVAGYVATLTGDSEAALSYAKVARRLERSGPLPDGHASSASAVANLLSALAPDGLSQMRDEGARVYELESPGQGRLLRTRPGVLGELLNEGAVVARNDERAFEVLVGYHLALDRTSWTMLWPFLYPMTFFVLLLGMAYGPGMGAVMAAHEHTSLDASARGRIRELVEPGTSAIFAMAASEDALILVGALEDEGGSIVRTHLTRADERQFRQALFGRTA